MALTWIKSSYSFSNSNCVEVAHGRSFGPSRRELVLVRDSKRPSGGTLIFPRAEWERFIRSLRP